MSHVLQISHRLFMEMMGITAMQPLREIFVTELGLMGRIRN